MAKRWTAADRARAKTRVARRFWTCPACARKNLAKYAYRPDPPRFVRVCRWCHATD